MRQKTQFEASHSRLKLNFLYSICIQFLEVPRRATQGYRKETLSRFDLCSDPPGIQSLTESAVTDLYQIGHFYVRPMCDKLITIYVKTLVYFFTAVVGQSR
jgi:hypothetical protein